LIDLVDLLEVAGLVELADWAEVGRRAVLVTACRDGEVCSAGVTGLRVTGLRVTGLRVTGLRVAELLAAVFGDVAGNDSAVSSSAVGAGEK
jgi:hypothetical protein